MGFLNTNSMPRLVEKLADGDNIKITGNSKGNRVGTVVKKIVEKADDVTKAIEQEVINDSYSFKVGTGNVDVSADVEDGFNEVGVKGVTYQNLLGKPTYFIQASIKDDIIETSNSGGARVHFRNSIIQPSKTYTLIFQVLENTTQSSDSNGNVGKFNLVSYNKGNWFIPQGASGTYVVKLTQPEIITNDGKPYFELYSGTTGDIKFKAFVLEGDHTNNPNLPSYFEGIVGVGDKSKNLFNPQKVADDLGLDVVSEGLVVNKPIGNRLYIDSITPKPNTVYHISIQEYLPITTNGTWSPIIGLEYTDGTSHESYTYTGLTFLTSSAKSVHRFYIRNPWPNVIGCWKNVHIVESKIATPYEPYYDGHKIEILSNGKNLYKPNLHVKSSNGLTFSLHGNTLIVNGTCTKIVDFRPINGTESIALELYNYVNKLPAGTTLSLSNNLGLKNYFSLKRNGVQTYSANTFIIQEGDYDISCFVRFEEGQSYNNAELKIQLEINNVATEYVPYVEDKTQILLDEPLMRLPNGVCDEITRDRELIRRVGKVVLDDTIDYQISGWGNQVNTLALNTTNPISNMLASSMLISNHLFTYGLDSKDIEGIVASGTSRLVFRILKTKLETVDVKGVKSYLRENPIIVYYELAEPIITELSAPYLRIFKDGHLTFNTLVAPESNHVVQLNKSAQIERSIREVQSLDSRVGKLESFYDDMMLETNHKLSLLNYDFEYTRERNGE